MKYKTKAYKVLEKMIKNAAGCLIILQSGKILLLKRNTFSSFPLTWCVPGGVLDKNESPYEAALRETKEESNIDIGQFECSNIYNQPLIGGYDGVFTTFIFEIPQFLSEEDFDVQIDQESLDWGWFTFKEMEELELHPGMYVLLDGMGVS